MNLKHKFPLAVIVVLTAVCCLALAKPSLAGDGLFYDSGSSGYLPQYGAAGTMFAVRFTPAEACTLQAMQVYSTFGPGDVLIHVWEDAAGTPGTDIITPFQVTFTGDNTAQNIFFSPYINLGTGDFHVGFELINGAPPNAVIDSDGNTEQRSKVKTPSGTWTALDNDLVLRCWVQYYVPSEGEVLFYDDPPTNVLFNPSGSGSMFAVRFTPGQSHFPDTCTYLHYVEIATIMGSGSGQVHVWEDNHLAPGNPGADAIVPIPTTFNGINTYQRIDIDPPVALDAFDFHAGWELLQSAPPYATTDSTGNTDNRSNAKSGGSWAPTANDLNIRAYVIYYNCSASSVEDGDVVEVPTGFGLAQNYPNPFNASTNITFAVDEASDVNVSVYNLAGQLVETVFSDNLNPGAYTVTWNASKYSSGIYFYKLTAGEQTTVKRMALLK